MCKHNLLRAVFVAPPTIPVFLALLRGVEDRLQPLGEEAKREETVPTKTPSVSKKENSQGKAWVESDIYKEGRPLPTMEQVNAELTSLKYDDPHLDMKLKKIQALKIKLQALCTSW